MATPDATKTVTAKKSTKLTLTVTLTLTDTVTVILFTHISLTPTKRLYRNNERNFCGGTVARFVGAPIFSHLLTFYLVADKNAIVSSVVTVSKIFHLKKMDVFVK